MAEKTSKRTSIRPGRRATSQFAAARRIRCCFRGLDCLDRGPVAIAASGLDLAEDHDPASPQDEVELAAGAPVVTVEDVVPAPPVIGGREILSGASEPGARVHGADARRWVRRKLALEPGRFRKHVPFRQLREFLDVEVAERDNLYL
jgi:hypothetical protein